MILREIDDYEQILNRFEAWWHCQIVDRPPVSVNALPTAQPNRPDRQGSRR